MAILPSLIIIASHFPDTADLLTILYFLSIVLLRPRQNLHDGEDRCVRPLQDEAVQEVQRERLLPLRHALPIHSRCVRDQSCGGADYAEAEVEWG